MLSAVLALATHQSLEELASIPFPVRPTHQGQESVIDVSVGLRTVSLLADEPLDGWRLITCADTRFQIAPETTGQQLADALSDPAVIEAMESLVMPPAMPALKKAQLAKLTGSEMQHISANRLIDCLSRHMTVQRAPVEIDPETKIAFGFSGQIAFI